MIQRPDLERKLRDALRRSPVVCLTGPRQCGKTTLAKLVAQGRRVEYFDLEDEDSQRRLSSPMFVLKSLRGLVVIDEVQARPDLFPLLRVLADRRPLPARFLILGSASGDLLNRSTESLAGRIAFVEMGGFSLAEVNGRPANMNRLWWRGRFPRAFLARAEAECRSWQEDFVRTFLQRDLEPLGVRVPAAALRRLWMMLAHYHGQTLNTSELSRSLGESHPTIRRHLDILTDALMVRQLHPWFENIGKRQVKAPTVYLRDSGILHALLDVPSLRALEGHPKVGASWEGFVIEEILQRFGDQKAFFWATQSGAELDLLLMLGGKRYGVEIKYGDAPGITKSMRIAMENLKLDTLFVVYPGTERYDLDKNITAIPLALVTEALLRG